jgi:hypothetical protein
MGWTNQVVIASEVIIAGEPDALLVYSGAPGPGTLIASITSTPLTDAYGNVTQPDIAAYGPGRSAGLFGGGLFLDTTSGASTTIVADGNQVAVDSVGALSASWWFGLPVVMTDPLGAQNPSSAGTADAWHDLRPSLVNSFTFPSGGYWPPAYILNALGQVEVMGTIELPAAYNSVTWGTIAADWCPLVQSFIGVQVLTNSGAAPGNSQSAYLTVSTAGALSFHGLPTGLSGGLVSFKGEYELDSNGLITS